MEVPLVRAGHLNQPAPTCSRLLSSRLHRRTFNNAHVEGLRLIGIVSRRTNLKLDNVASAQPQVADNVAAMYEDIGLIGHLDEAKACVAKEKHFTCFHGRPRLGVLDLESL